MAKRNIVTFGESVLEKNCRKIEKFDEKLFTLLEDMKETLEEANGVGLAAPQVGMLKRVFIIDLGDGVIEFINPEILEESGVQDGMEGCLSNPGKYGMVERPNYVKIKAQDRNGDYFELEGEELMARALCHEYDHLNGTLFISRVSRMLTDEELEEMRAEAEREEEEEE